MLSHGQAKKFYDFFGSAQDWQRFYEDAAVNDLTAHLSLKNARQLFEFGCGTGRLAEKLLENHLGPDARYTAVDISTTMTGLTKKRLAKFGDRVTVLQTLGTMTLRAPSHSFDRFISTYVLDLLTEKDIRQLIAEAHRLLSPGGLIGLVSLTHAQNPAGRVVEKLWIGVHAVLPILLGGCRPITLADFVKQDTWHIVHHRKISQCGIASEVLVAGKTNDDAED